MAVFLSVGGTGFRLTLDVEDALGLYFVSSYFYFSKSWFYIIYLLPIIIFCFKFVANHKKKDLNIKLAQKQHFSAMIRK